MSVASGIVFPAGALALVPDESGSVLISAVIVSCGSKWARESET